MSLITSFYPTDNAFTRNPIIVNITAQTLATYKVYADGVLLFTGNGVGSFSVNISEILETAFQETVAPTGTNMIMLYTQASNRVSATFEISTSPSDTETVNFVAWKGGINRTDYRELEKAGTDVFREKLMNYSGNFFFTTRTFGWKISIKETELEPMAFIMPLPPGENVGRMIIREAATGKQVTVNGPSGALEALNIDAVRKHFFDQYGVLANLFDIMDPVYAQRVACRIAIEEAPAAAERCAVKFLNSFGIYERIDLVGPTTVNTAQEQENTGIYQKYDTVTDSFVKDRTRTEIGKIYRVKTEPKRTDEMNFILDMLASDSVYLVLPDREIKVIPAAENMGYAYSQKEPETLTLSFTPVEKESNFSALRTKYGSTRPRIFTSVFSEQFN